VPAGSRPRASQARAGRVAGRRVVDQRDRRAPGQEHYAASKTALLAVMRGLAVELARHKVRCNSLLPGWTPVRRWGTLHDFETVGAFLADPSLIFHTRDSMVVDGSYTIF
jgi:NAD(P)-dependent dehydrogenase (short-subunit alcohol dehydrogenase family)